MRVSIRQSISNNGVYLLKLGQNWRVVEDVVSETKNDHLGDGVEGVCLFFVVRADGESQKFNHQLSKGLQVMSKSEPDICFEPTLVELSLCEKLRFDFVICVLESVSEHFLVLCERSLESRSRRLV